ncbi:putative anthocyanidin reductase ((2R,3R)-flavan-3-ol-forming) [Helianthus annuus]|nr:putative anthocyanidin reductase ((2R,3R)-flavan-3-ol-forming) [Helianthus annuus]
MIISLNTTIPLSKRTFKHPLYMQIYVLSKRLTEDAAFKFAKDNNIQLVSVITTTATGPFLTLTVPLSIRFLLSPIIGDSELLPLLSAVNSRMGSIALVHTEDICNAHLYLMEHDQAQGSYICCTNSCTMSELVHHFAKVYPSSSSQRSKPLTFFLKGYPNI